jgi:hypothetical protein
MARLKHNTAANQAFVPAGMEYEEWRIRFEHSLKVGTTAWKGFKTWMSVEEESANKFKMPWANDVRDHVLRMMHAETSPLPNDKKARDNRAYTIKALKHLVAQLNSVLGHIRKTGVFVETDGGLGLDFSSDLEVFQHAANRAASSLALLEVRGPDSLRRDAIDQCLWFLESRDGWIPEAQAFALAKLALMAHGYRDVDLVDLDTPGGNGKVSKRKKTLVKLYWDTLDCVKRRIL